MGKYGLKATIDAFDVGRSTLYLWQQKKTQGDLAPKSRRPKLVRRPTTPVATVEAVSGLRRAFPFLGKEKLANLLMKSNIKVSASTVARIIIREHLPSAPKRYVARMKWKKRNRLSSDYQIKKAGDLVGMDTIVIQEQRSKKYIITAVDYHTRIAIARMYTHPTSRNAQDLLRRMAIALGMPIQAVNTDNGSEFLAEYGKACHALTITHFFTYPRSPKMNPLTERFNRTIQKEATLPLFQESIETWNRHIADYIMLYNFFRQYICLRGKLIFATMKLYHLTEGIAMSEKLKDGLEITEEELKQAEESRDKTIEKVFGDKLVKIIVYSFPGFNGNKLAEIERKMRNREGLNQEERKIAIKAGLIDKDQAWFSTPEWQQAMKESEDDLKAGRYKEADNIDDLLADLKRPL